MYPSASSTRAVWLWEADTVDAVRDLVELAGGEFGRNEFFEISRNNAIGLPA